MAAENSTVSIQDSANNAPEMGVHGRPKLLEKTLQQTVDRFTSSIGFSLFKKHYRQLYEQDRAGLRTIFHHFVKSLNDKISAEVQQDVADQNLSKHLTALDDLIAATKEAKTEKEAWRPSGNPAQDLAPHRIAVKLKAKDELQEMLRKLKAEDDELKSTIVQKREMMIELEAQLDNKLQYFEKAASACRQLSVPEIRENMEKPNAST